MAKAQRLHARLGDETYCGLAIDRALEPFCLTWWELLEHRLGVTCGLCRTCAYQEYHAEKGIGRMLSFSDACKRYIYRYTMEHKPIWAVDRAPNGRFYAPQYTTDLEWYASTLFPPDNPMHRTDCYSSGQTWPLGQWLDKPFHPSRWE